MFYQTEQQTQYHTRLPETPPFRPSFLNRLDSSHKLLLEQRLVLQKLVEQQLKRKKTKLKSKNSIWDTVKLLERFAKPEYQSTQAKIDLLKFDANHHASEMALVEPVKRFSYWHTIENNETLGDGYSEDLGFMLNTFAQDLAENGFNASRATVETVTFERAKKQLAQIAIRGSKEAILITSFPDDKKSGYHGVDSKHDWNKPETHHSFFYFLTVGDVKRDTNKKVTSFEIKTTQYRAWPNANQALDIHARLGQPITKLDAPVPNLLFANLIQLDQVQLQELIKQLNIEKNDISPQDENENEFEKLFKQVLYKNSEQHAISHKQVPEVDLEQFWQLQETYFNDFYLDVALPVFAEINELKSRSKKLDKKTLVEIQTKIDYLDKAFFYYSKILLGWIKINNQNSDYTDAFKEKNKVKVLMDFQQKLLLRLMGQKETKEIPTVNTLKVALDIDHRLATNQYVSPDEKKKLLSLWGFFSFVGRFGSLLQCGAMAPFTAPMSILKGTLGKPSIPEFSGAVGNISIPDQKKFLNALQSEEYVELDLTGAEPVGANQIYSVPKSYLEKEGCIVDKNGEVLGPCIETILEDGVEVKKRIKLSDKRDTLAFPMPLSEFKKYLLALQKNIEQNSLSEIDNIFQSSDFSFTEKRKAQVAIKKLRLKFIKKSLGLQEFITGDLVTQEATANNEWLTALVIKLSFSQNPVETLIKEVEAKLKENATFFEDTIQEN